LGVCFVSIDASRKLTGDDIEETIEALDAGDILHFDEAHCLSKGIQDLLLGASGESRKLACEAPHSSAASGMEFVSVADFTLILSTNIPGALRSALISRCPMRIHLEPYSTAEMREIVRALTVKRNLHISNQALTPLVEVARGIPRRAAHWIDLAYMYFPGADGELTKSDVCDFLRHSKIETAENLMLDAYEQQYLRILLAGDKPMVLGHLAHNLGLDRKFVFEEIETLLVRDGLVELADSKRRLTEKGRSAALRLMETCRSMETENEEE
jgi:Holliday junction resolvasome RuvABC ATP-dependent DNA helicase subunit